MASQYRGPGSLVVLLLAQRPASGAPRRTRAIEDHSGRHFYGTRHRWEGEKDE